LHGWDVNEQAFQGFTSEEKRLTGQAIRETKADVIALQEVENLETLKRFRTQFLGGPSGYRYAIAVDGNDPRLIDVALLSRHPIVHVRSYHHIRSADNRSYLFSRDCLEADIQLPDNRVVTLFVNHLKSMLDMFDPCNGRANTRARRAEQAEAVVKIIQDRFGAKAGDADFVVLGDLNDYMESDTQGEPGIGALVEWAEVENVVDRMPEDERWTHFYAGNASCGVQPSYHQLDYVLLSRSLADQTDAQPEIMRKGIPTRADRYQGPRFEGIGVDSPKASDAVIMEIR
jgi:endonuclease/exonuclease/phosphatase family metal-dependent hydrolase